MSDNPNCPSADQLHRALTGELPPDQIVAIEQHLLECAPCAQQTLNSGDLQTISQALRQSSLAGEAEVPKADAVQLAQLIERLRELPYQQPVTQLFGDQEGSRNVHLELELVKYLHPARAADEIGWLGPYRVLKLLGSGGMGGVFLAEDTQLHRRVALKVMRPDVSGQFHADERFLREARAAAAVHHDHIVTIFQVGRDGQVPFLAMEFLEGESLEDRLRREHVTPLNDVLRIGREIAEGLAAAHSRGLVHRDIKPANIWLEARGGTIQADAVDALPPRVKLLDFGLARAADANFELTSRGMVIGTPAYMAPEQAAGDMVDHRADLFSFGVVLYRLATGALPFQGKDAISTLVSIRSETPEDPRLRRQDLPEELSALVMQLLKKNPDERPASAADTAKQLARIVLPRPGSEIPSNIPTTESPSRPLTQRFIWRIVAAFLFLLLLSGIVVIATDRGQVEVVIDSKDDDVDVQVVVTRPDGYFQVFDNKTGSRVKGFWSGKYEVEIKGDANSFVVDKTDFVLKRGKTEILTVTRRPTSEIPSNAEPAKNPANVAQSVLVPEPPPLSEWLKGRKVLTVAQDGSGQFKTIQAALDALQPGQVVKVLDRGPYTESLRCTVPRDTGLISDVQTVLEAIDWPAQTHPQQIVVIEGFRLNGFRLQARLRPEWFEVLHVTTPSGLVVENCSFGLSVPDQDHAALCSGLQLSFDQYQRALQPVWIRDCLLEKSVGADGPLANGTIVVENNLFRDCGVAMSKVELQTLVVRHNVFENPKLHPTWYGDPVWFGGVSSVKETLEIVNNTASMPSDSRSTGIQFVKVLPPNNVVIRNNLSDSNVVMSDQLWNGKPNPLEIWQMDHNGYSREYRPQMRATTDIVGRITFLSTDTSNADAWRIAVDSPLAAGGAGGYLPGYIGALPPGPAPKDGDWFTRLRERWSTEGVKRPETSSPAEIPEPPPLAEWLKGRKVLTVAQDGSGQFKTIQAALDALQPGEAVKVLDKGPYRERLGAPTLPHDSGLVSEVQTILDAPEWKLVGQEDDPATGGKVDVYHGHSLNGANGFRWHGFEMRFPPSNGKRVLRCGGVRTKSFVLENCFIHASESLESFEGEPFAISDWDKGDGAGMSVYIRDCVIEGSVGFFAQHKRLPLDPDRRSTVVVERNYFVGVGTKYHLAIAGPSMEKAVVRHNVFAGKSDIDIKLALVEASDSLEVSNNLLLSPTGIAFQECTPHGAVTIRNNVHTSDAIVSFNQGIAAKLRQAARSWNMDHNAYPDLPAGVPPENVLPRPSGDLSVLPRFLSKVPQDADYLRIPADDPLATAGAGGKWPKYIGAAPPGPVPKAGDWFSRLRERWSIENVKRPETPSPVKISEPPPLAEWLKGRKVRTVAQDGSGEFKTIQAALDALQSGEVVKVLDKGPYRERLDVRSPPDDTGLITDQWAVIELSEWKYDLDLAPVGHMIRFAHGFRMHGFVMTVAELPTKPSLRSYALTFNQPEQFVLEQCSFQFPAAPDLGIVVGAAWWNPAAETRLSVIRDCDFGGALTLNSLSKGKIGMIRNWFHGQSDSHIHIADKNYDLVLIRENIFAGKYATRDIALNLVEDSRIDTFEISNNTMLSSSLLDFTHSAPLGKMSVVNNLRQSPGLLKLSGDAVRDLPRVGQEWQVGHNSYPRQATVGEQVAVTEGLYPQSATDILVAPSFLATASRDREYLRLPAASPLATGGAGGDWPNYIGALSPGPVSKDGDWFTRLQVRWGGLKPTAVSSAGPVQVDEPPPLADWLKGRKVLTVAQDGSGQFTTIQAAMDALQPGQTIKVLDKGPYRELLYVAELPPDSGLITEVQTILESPEWKVDYQEDAPTGGKVDVFRGHSLNGANGFRMHGFEMRFPPSNGMRVRRCGGGHTKNFVLENCFIRTSESESLEGEPINFADWHNVNGVGLSVWIRDCVIEGSVAFMALDKREPGEPEFRSGVAIVRNYFTGVGTEHHLLMAGESMAKVLIRHNVFAGKSGIDIHLHKLSTSDSLEISNNLLLSPTGVRFLQSASVGTVTIRNNAHVRDAMVSFYHVDGAESREVAQRWNVDHNAYPAVRAGMSPEHVLARPPGDIAVLPRFLSKVPREADYLRIPEDDPLATGGADGKWPKYIGALPPGPAPNDGDWFTRLKARSLVSSRVVSNKSPAAAPTPIPEVPALAEWLKGREVITVAQDGTGQHKTIASAMSAVKTGQVVKVLDRGPYRERLLLRGLPPDIGLVSDQKTILQTENWEAGPAAQDFGPIDGFRLSGFRLLAPRAADWTALSSWHQPNGLVIEDCFFGRFGNAVPPPGCDPAVYLTFGTAKSETKPALIRHCLFEEGAVAAGPQEAPGLTPIFVSQNIFQNGQLTLASKELGTVVVRENVFERGDMCKLYLDGIKTIYKTLEISNNTVVVPKGSMHTTPTIIVATAVPDGNVVVRNNITCAGIHFDDSAKQRITRINDWQIDHNAFSPNGWSPAFNSPSNIQWDPIYLSTDPKHQDVWRIAPGNYLAKRGAGGAWPNHVGAFPPGPPQDGDWFISLRERWKSFLNAM